jgi:hypothetical protein
MHLKNYSRKKPLFGSEKSPENPKILAFSGITPLAHIVTGVILHFLNLHWTTDVYILKMTAFCD